MRPQSSRKFVSQFVEIADDVVFTVEYSVRAAQMAVYELLEIDREIPAISRHDKSAKVKFDAVLEAFACDTVRWCARELALATENRGFWGPLSTSEVSMLPCARRNYGCTCFRLQNQSKDELGSL